MGSHKLNVPAFYFSLLLDFVLTARWQSLWNETCCCTKMEEITCLFSTGKWRSFNAVYSI